jgi:hypothetical protein
MLMDLVGLRSKYKVKPNSTKKIYKINYKKIKYEKEINAG